MTVHHGDRPAGYHGIGHSVQQAGTVPLWGQNFLHGGHPSEDKMMHCHVEEASVAGERFLLGNRQEDGALGR